MRCDSNPTRSSIETTLVAYVQGKKWSSDTRLSGYHGNIGRIMWHTNFKNWRGRNRKTQSMSMTPRSNACYCGCWVEEKRAAATCLNVGGGWVVSGGWWMVVLVVPRIRIIIIIYNYYTSFLGNNLNWIRIISGFPEEAGSWLPPKIWITPLKFNMEPENTPLEKENHLNQTIISRFKLLNFGGVDVDKISKYSNRLQTTPPRVTSIPHSLRGPWKFLSSKLNSCHFVTWHGWFLCQI